MSTLSYAMRDSATMLRRDLRHSVRNAAMTISGLLVPIVMLVLFVYVFGGAIGAGLGGASLGGAYINYVTPAIFILTAVSGMSTTAVNLSLELQQGIIARFRTMAISPTSVLTGQVIGSLVRTMASVVLVTVVALFAGFHPSTGPAAWLVALGLITLITFALTWMAVVFGIVGKTPGGANSLSFLFQILILTSSAFVRPETMSGWVRGFAEYQPFTPIIDTLRGLLLGTPIGNSAVFAIAWCVILTLVGFLWARAAYNRTSARQEEQPRLI